MLLAMTHHFAETRWTLVQRAQGHTAEATAALSELCEAYYTPVHRFVCGWCNNADEARDLTQEFFARLLAKPQIGGAAPEHGKFRSFLLGAVKHFLCDMRDHGKRLKRGGGVEHVTLDAPQGSNSDALHPAGIEDASTPPPDVEFDRQWALHVLERALESLEKAFAEDGKAPHFQALKPWLISSKVSDEEAAAASTFGLQDGALRVAVHRLRQRFREQLRREIAQTLAAGADVDLEMQHLLAALRQQGG
ncbi:RNA polymerase sigma-70 factor (ECF subfamily) [Roseimicrobium gellanilyticum]|uniref:RNA polymerase sigma-70 factor (ECF subfamily) n=1 Tax=Roseimicrobium gellanilyticum TaxID=748857 RepID=A0A366HU30_9BACT|nr:sigma factor [Roseimicrobium gellanilyticum]RBP47340.1 RNA polymerase sigma-70 factor (ECF subfamily) [Roseimicrobium gellanilyticum]